MKRFLGILLMIGLLLMLASPMPVSSQGTETASVRIGYIGLDPTQYDTYLDGQLASFSSGWAKVGWAIPLPGAPMYRADTATPYMSFAVGAHSFAFVPAGKELGAAVLGPQDVTFKAGHRYSLAIVGKLDKGTLSLLTFDETTMYQGTDPAKSYYAIAVNDILGAPPMNMLLGPDKQVVIDQLKYGQGDHYVATEEWEYIALVTAENKPFTLFELDPSNIQYRLTDLGVYSGSYPGEAGKDFFDNYNWNYAGDVTLDNAGRVAVGDVIAGKIVTPTHRNAYSLTLDADTVVDVIAMAAGPATQNSISSPGFDPKIYIYNRDGNLLFWNDSGIGLAMVKGGEANTDDASLTAVSLKAGTYSIQVGGFADLVAGPYALIVRPTPGAEFEG